MIAFPRTPIGFCLALCCCAIGVLAGCRSQVQVVKDRARVSGTVIFDGKPLRAGTIVFKSANSRVGTSASISDGAYSTDRAPLGKNAVTIDTTSIRFGAPAAYVPIPQRYNNSETSGLTADIQSGDNENVDFTLEKSR